MNVLEHHQILELETRSASSDDAIGRGQIEVIGAITPQSSRVTGLGRERDLEQVRLHEGQHDLGSTVGDVAGLSRCLVGESDVGLLVSAHTSSVAAFYALMPTSLVGVTR